MFALHNAFKNQDWPKEPTFEDALDEFSLSVKVNFQKTILRELKRSRRLSPAMQNALIERGVDSLLVDVVEDPQVIRQLLKATGLDERVQDLEHVQRAPLLEAGDALCLIRLPRVFCGYQAYLFKAKAPPAERNALSDIDRIYYRAISAFWTEAKYACQKHGLRLIRINESSHHDNSPSGFYYAFLLRSYTPHDRYAHLDHANAS